MNSSLARAGLATLVLCCVFGRAANGQTLDSEYDWYLTNKCDNMGFARNFDDQELLPGQAGPNLFAFCTGPYFLPSGISVSSTGVGGGSGVAAGRSHEASEDAALRRRRDQQHTESEGSAQAVVSVGSVTGAFGTLDYRSEGQDATEFEGGRDAERFVVTLGVDHRFGRLVAGGALRLDNYSGDFDTGGDFRSEGIGATLYASFLPLDGLFIDASGAFDRRSIDTNRIVARKITVTDFTPPTTVRISYNPQARLVSGSSHSDEISADLLAGYDFSLGAVSVGPRLGGSWRKSTLDPYSEIGATPMSLAFDRQEETSLRSLVGVQTSMAFSGSIGVAVPQLIVQWNHEYQDDQHIVTAHFAEDLRPNPTQLRFLNEAPDRDTYTARLSVAMAFKEGLNAFVSYDKLFAHDYQQQSGASLGFRWELR